MNYQFVKTKENYEDLASGRVLYNAKGTTSFPVRLASEIIQRCFAQLKRKGIEGPYTIYDPCCGGGYLLTVIGFLHPNEIQKIYASDINQSVLTIAEKNLSLLSTNGILQRKKELTDLFALYHKPSHYNALQSLDKLKELHVSNIPSRIFTADIMTNNIKVHDMPINIILADLPYGGLVKWESDNINPIEPFFDAISNVVNSDYSVVGVIADKSQKLNHSKFNRLSYEKVGKRHFGIFELK